MGNIKHIAIDTGKRSTKVVFELSQVGHSQTISFPTAIAEGIDETADSNSHIIEFNGISYLVGEQALTGSEIDSANSKNNEIHKICILTALGLAFKSGTTVEAVIGIPLDLYMNKEEKKNYRDNMLPVGEIEFKIDGENRKIIVAKTIIRPEGYGAIYNRREDIADSIINVVDIGGLNVNACEYRMGNMQELSRKTMQMGGKYLYTQSLDAIRKAVTPDERKRMENLTAEDFEHYVVKGAYSKLAGSEEIFKKVRLSLVKAIKNAISTGNNKLSLMNDTYFIGGTAFLLREEIKEVFGAEYCKFCADNYEEMKFANARGFYKLLINS